MRPVLFCVLTILIMIHNGSQIQAATMDKESIIIEVDGDPTEHKKYIETYHPYIDVIATYEKLFNGLALQGDPEKLAKMESLEFIKTIHPVHVYETNQVITDNAFDPSILDLDDNIVIPGDLNTTDYTGKGVKVGVIDTGIDYDHPDLAINYVGGYDLVDLDDDPMETGVLEGIPTIHGTHVAGIIAANGKIQGVATDAEIYAYRALGPGGSGTSVQVIAAMEEAVKDGVDIMNLSLGNTVNGPDYPTSIAVNQAVELGVEVVIANGNDGPEDWTVGSPATATKALSVGASALPQSIPYLYEPQAERTIPMNVMMGSIPWKLEKDYEVINIAEQEDAHGKIALLKRDSEIPFYDLAKEVQQAGAVAAIIFNNEKEDFQGSLNHFEEPLDIPVVGVSGDDGKWLQDQLDPNPLYLQTGYKRTNVDVAPFSSRGPVTVNWDIKPDLLAPGANILSTVPDGYQALQGTSMAAPHVAGVIALVKEAHPNWSNEQITGALKTTAEQIQTETGDPLDPTIQGMGQIRPQKAIDATTIIHHPLLAFGKMNTYRETTELMITIENMTNETQDYTFDMPKKKPGLSWKLPQTFSLEKGEARNIPIQLNVTTPLLAESIHQGWLTLNQAAETYNLPYVFINKTADYPKAMGFEFSLKPFSEDMYIHRIYMPDKAKSVTINLYDPDSLLYQRRLLQVTELEVGLNEGHIKKSELGEPGHYKALITVQLENGKYANYETHVFIE